MIYFNNVVVEFLMGMSMNLVFNILGFFFKVVKMTRVGFRIGRR